MESILDLEDTSAISAAFKLSLAMPHMTADRLRNVRYSPVENTDKMLESEPDTSNLFSANGSSTTAPELGNWPTDTSQCQEMSPTSLEHEVTFGSRNIRVIKHKPSVITFTDFPFDIISDTILSDPLDNDTSEDKDSNDGSDEDQEDEGDDVFTDLPPSKHTFTGIKRRSSHPRRLNGNISDSKGFGQLLPKRQWNNGMKLDDEERKSLMVSFYYSLTS